ncbi:hypothetical protein WR25_00725 [Diploscapter pachys]|uniref:Uncharacterized protein n=1 Tax=Diploscapter pachys TaxID=2018661 RepID=A0A2A2LEV9_9BILA|nr:hypothetical protein WR25_00725 [Diploscapter pachys]
METPFSKVIDHSSLLLNCTQSSLQEMRLTVLIAATVSVLIAFVSAHGHGGGHSSGGGGHHSGGHSYSGGHHHSYHASYFGTSSSSSYSSSSGSSGGGGLLSWLFPGLFGNSYSSYGNYYSPYNYGMPSIVGIDLGTTFSCVATIGPSGEPEAIANFDGANTTPSVVAYSDDGIFVGKTAVRLRASPKNVIYDSKRFIGRQYNDISVQNDMKLWPFVVINDRGKPIVKLNQNGVEKRLAAEEVSAEVLKTMKEVAEKYLNEEVTKAVITVPANFDQRQRHATMGAAKLAGIEVIRLVNEPTAAAIAYGLHNQGTNNVLVYDLGGGTFDVSIVTCEGDKRLHIIATSGHKHLGGQDLDKIIMDYALKNFSNFPKHNAKMMKRLLEMCTEAKIALSSHEITTILVDDTSSDDDWELKLTRNKFEGLCGSILRGTLDIVDEALRQARMTKSDIDIVVFD